MKKIVYYILVACAVVIILACIAMIPPVADRISKATGMASDKIKGIAQRAVSIAVGVALVSWGVAALAMPLLGGLMIVAGLGLLAWALWPLFQSSKDLGK